MPKPLGCLVLEDKLRYAPCFFPKEKRVAVYCASSPHCCERETFLLDAHSALLLTLFPVSLLFLCFLPILEHVYYILFGADKNEQQTAPQRGRVIAVLTRTHTRSHANVNADIRTAIVDTSFKLFSCFALGFLLFFALELLAPFSFTWFCVSCALFNCLFFFFFFKVKAKGRSASWRYPAHTYTHAHTHGDGSREIEFPPTNAKKNHYFLRPLQNLFYTIDRYVNIDFFVTSFARCVLNPVITCVVAHFLSPI